MGLRVSVLTGDYINDNGVFGAATVLTVVNVDGPFKPSADAPAAILEQGPIGSVRIVPAEPQERLICFSGKYAATSDSRFGRALLDLGYPSHCAVAIHDQFL